MGIGEQVRYHGSQRISHGPPPLNVVVTGIADQGSVEKPVNTGPEPGHPGILSRGQGPCLPGRMGPKAVENQHNAL